MESNISDVIKSEGKIQAFIEYLDGKTETIRFSNAILRSGRQALAASLANEFGSDYNYFITRMLFGDGGTTGGGVPKFITEDRTGLFGTTQVNKPVISTIDPNNLTTAIFTSVVTYNDGNGVTLNEMALQMNNGAIYSMATHGGVAKTSQMQITWTWEISLL